MRYLTMKFYSAVFVVVMLASFATAHATSKTYSYVCSDGGTINTVVSIDPEGPFPANAHPKFEAKGRMISTCTTKSVSLTAQNNDGTKVTVIDPRSIAYGETYPAVIPATVAFTAPDPAGTYAVKFSTGVDDNIPPKITSQPVVNEVPNILVGGGVGTGRQGYYFSVAGVCFSDVAIQDEKVKTSWTSSNGQPYSFYDTVPAGNKCSAGTYNMPGPSTGDAGQTSNICVRAENPNIHVANGIPECPPDQPWASITAQPLAVKEGGASNLKWESLYTDSCISPDFDTGGAARGTASTGPLLKGGTLSGNGAAADVAQYTLTCSGIGGSTTVTTQVKICSTEPLLNDLCSL